MKLLSYNNDPKLKCMMVAEMKIHRDQDQIIKGTYGKQNGKWVGCAVGCSIHSLNVRLGKSLPTDQHLLYESELGFPEWLARLEDDIFEHLPDADATEFPLALLKAVNVGSDLTKVKWQFSAFLLRENIERVLTLQITDELKEQVVASVRQVLDVNESAIKSGNWAESAAESAARSAARSARSAAWSTESAAWSARSAAWSAESAAWSARSAAWSAKSAAWSAESAESAAWSARSAARSAAYVRYSKELLRLLKEAK